MIKNILFDMGNVLIRWDPPAFLNRYPLSDEDKKILMNEVFASIGWVQLDRGIIDDKGFLEITYPRIPERLHETARLLTTAWDKPEILPMEGMEEIVKTLYEKGYGLYLLSNASLRHPEYWPSVPGSQYFGSHLAVSAFMKVVKPEKEFYNKALSMFGLKADECLFIDDNPANCEAALLYGIRSIVFHQDAALLKFRLQDFGINI